MLNLWWNEYSALSPPIWIGSVHHKKYVWIENFPFFTIFPYLIFQFVACSEWFFLIFTHFNAFSIQQSRFVCLEPRTLLKNLSQWSSVCEHWTGTCLNFVVRCLASLIFRFDFTYLFAFVTLWIPIFRHRNSYI